MVVDHCCKQVVCCTDRMEVTGEVKVDILHRHNLCISAACCSALYTKYRSEGRLTKCYHYILAKLLHTICKTYGRCGLSFSGRCRIDCGNKDQFSVFFIRFFQKVIINFCFIITVLLQIFGINSCFLRNLCDRKHLRFLCNFNVCFESHCFQFSFHFHLSVLISEISVIPAGG